MYVHLYRVVASMVVRSLVLLDRLSLLLQGTSHGTSSIDKLSYDHLLLAILDSNPYLSDSSKQVSSLQPSGRGHNSEKGKAGMHTLMACVHREYYRK